MAKSFSRLSLFFLSVLVINWGCTKIDTTSLGADLIPVVDNVHTFADTLDVVTLSQGLMVDTTRLTSSDYHIFGSISNDPVFGTTHSDCYLELKPTFFPYYFGSNKDTIDPVLAPGTGFDSAVLCLSVKGYYGDTTKPQKFSVYLLNQNTGNFKDSAYQLNYLPDQPLGQLIGQASVIPQDVKSFIRYKGTHFPDSVNYQVRIPLSQSFLNNLVANLDTSATGSGNNIYRSDSIFRSIIKGFAIKTDRDPSSNGLFYTTVTDAKTRLEVHYRKKNAGRLDTLYSSFFFAQGAANGITALSAHACNFERNRTGAEISNPEADAIYMQTTPGSFAHLSIPGIAGLNNRIIHRAELYMEQVPANTPALAALDASLQAPGFLYLDLIDTPATATRYKTIYKDLNPNSYYDPDNSISFWPGSGIDFAYYGGYLRTKVDPLTGGTLHYYTFNMTRHLQQIVTRQTLSYNFRLMAPFRVSYYGYFYGFNNSFAFGRIKLGGGNHPQYKMRLRIVYSKI